MFDSVAGVMIDNRDSLDLPQGVPSLWSLHYVSSAAFTAGVDFTSNRTRVAGFDRWELPLGERTVGRAIEELSLRCAYSIYRVPACGMLMKPCGYIISHIARGSSASEFWDNPSATRAHF